MQPSLEVDDPYPLPGEATGLRVSAADTDQITSCSWSVETTSGPDATLKTDELTAKLTLDEGSHAIVRAIVTLLDGTSYDLSVSTAAATWIEVESGDDLAAAVGNADEGARVLLGEGEWEVDTLRLERPIRFIGQGAYLSHIELAGPLGVVATGILARFEGLTLSSPTNVVLLSATDSTIEVERSRFIGSSGSLAIQSERSAIVIRNTAILGSSYAILSNNSTIELSYAVIGWPVTPQGAALAGIRTTWQIEGSVLEWPEPWWPLLVCGNGCAADVNSSMLVLEETLDTGGLPAPERPSGLENSDISIDIPGFLRPPGPATSPEYADLRLLDNAAGIDAGPEDETDSNGSRADLGIFGGPLGDWPDVDNDRDGFTNNEGDCDDLDAEAIPNPAARSPCETAGCACQTGGATSGAWLALALLGIRRANRVRRG